MFRANAFRITGLPVDATTREITKHADKLKMMEELGQGKSAHTGAFALTPPPSIDQIRDAIQCLRDPERRLLDEFFWFWPDDFGSSAQDPAIQALAGGDRETALEIWTLKETSPTAGLTAMHNVAVLWQLVALEWEEYAAQEQVDDERRGKIEGYWRNAFKRWDLLAADDLLWERVSARVKQIDDPRLTTGFVRKMRATLPQALDKINAELAVRYAESGRMNLAQVHVRFMRETNQGFDSIDKIAELVLAPTTTRLKQQIDRAQKRADKNPADAVNAARELLNYAPSSLILFELFFGKESEARNELSDEVATLCNRLQLTYHKATGDNKGCSDLLRMALPFAISTEVRQQIEKNIGTLNSNIAYAQLAPVLGVLHGIDESTASPKVKLGRIKQEIIPTLAELIRKEGSASNSASEFANSIAISLRGISISAYNDHDDIDTALEAIGTACDLAREAELKRRLLDDKAQLTRNKAEEEKRNLLLEIRSDTIEVTRERFRYNSHVIPANDITGVRFGIFMQYTNGIKSSVSYKVAVSSARHGTADIECKRFFRDEDKAAADFQAIVGALYWQIIPALCSRLASSIVGGARIALGDCTMTNKGILATTGMLLWKEDHVISWSDVRFGTHAGHLNISSAKNPKVTKAFVLREVWNAVIFKELANAVVTLQGKQRTL
ncbi:MAG: hypothetical protein WDN28_30935 [Chthoniobacter sp.]